MASDLRDEIARAIQQAESIYREDDDPSYVADFYPQADAVLRVVGERLMADAVVEAARVGFESEAWSGTGWSAALSAAWRVVTGSNHE